MGPRMRAGSNDELFSEDHYTKEEIMALAEEHWDEDWWEANVRHGSRDYNVQMPGTGKVFYLDVQDAWNDLKAKAPKKPKTVFEQSLMDKCQVPEGLVSKLVQELDEYSINDIEELTM